MAYLLAKYTLLFLFTALLSFVLGHWWARRRFVDVTESYEDLRSGGQADDGLWNALWQRLEELSISLGRTVREELASGPHEPAQVDLSGLQNRLGVIERMIDGIEIPAQREPDFSELHERLASLEYRIGNIQIPAPPILKPLEQRLLDMQVSLKKLEQKKDDGGGGKHLDVAPLKEQLKRIEVNMQSLLGSLQGPHIAVPPGGGQASQGPVAGRAEPLLLDEAVHGPKDDLKQISGVGPKLEDLLNQLGVYYFWQISDWSAADIELLDARLETFKGRIRRDNWVAQARALMRAPGAARQPE